MKASPGNAVLASHTSVAVIPHSCCHQPSCHPVCLYYLWTFLSHQGSGLPDIIDRSRDLPEILCPQIVTLWLVCLFRDRVSCIPCWFPSHYVDEDILGLLGFSPLFPKCRDCRFMPLHLPLPFKSLLCHCSCDIIDSSSPLLPLPCSQNWG